MARFVGFLQLPIFFFILAASVTKTKGSSGYGVSIIGELCDIDRNCLTNQMICVSSTCECLQGYYPSNDNRNCIATTSSICFQDADCSSLQHSSCFIQESIEGLCVCDDGYSASEDEKSCLSAAGYLSSCTQQSQCAMKLGSHASCNGTCGCQTNFHFADVDGQCIGDVGLEGACQNNTQCVTSDRQNGRAQCQDNKCVCISGYVRDGDKCTDNGDRVIFSAVTMLLCWITKFIIS